jgi:Polysaccharide biosynthesis
MEKQFAVKGEMFSKELIFTYIHSAVQHMMTYWAILEKARGSKLRLTKIDDEIFEHFKKDFPDIDVSETIDEDKMKSKEGKERWRKFMEAYSERVDDYNFGTMLRRNPKFEYGEKETMFGMTTIELTLVCI